MRNGYTGIGNVMPLIYFKLSVAVLMCIWDTRITTRKYLVSYSLTSRIESTQDSKINGKTLGRGYRKISKKVFIAAIYTIGSLV